MEGVKLPRRERERLDRRREILAAALDLFSKKGYFRVSMDEIAGRAEFAIGTVYKFFKNKDDLYSALILEEARRVHDALIRGVKRSDHEVDEVRGYVMAKGEAFCTRTSTIRLYFAEIEGAGFNVIPERGREIQQLSSDLRRIVASVFESGMKKRIFRRIADPIQLAVTLEHMTNGFIFLWLEEPESHPYPKSADTILDVLFEGVLV
ncbi:MAG: TetR/AcrR family transcriptional regulator [bacterium]